jgi:FKBP-type peptidyl-prolyl cis-trans isomerase
MRSDYLYKFAALTSTLIIAGCMSTLPSNSNHLDNQIKTNAQKSSSRDELILSSEKQRISYGLGTVLGKRLLEDFDKLEYELLKEGIKDSFEGNRPALTESELSRLMTNFQNKKKVKNTVIKTFTTDSGLKIEIFEYGTGPYPNTNSNVKVHYKGYLQDGTVFDNSYSRNEPAIFPLKGVIKGWTEGLQHINEGGRARITIPPSLAYGPKGAGGVIGPNETLIFEIKLLEVTHTKSLFKPGTQLTGSSANKESGFVSFISIASRHAHFTLTYTHDADCDF